MAEDTWEQLLDDLRSLYPALTDRQLLETNRLITHIAHGWYTRTHRTCDAVMLLRASGYATEAWPLRRTIIEHTVALKWLAADGSRSPTSSAAHTPLERGDGVQPWSLPGGATRILPPSAT